VHRPLLHRLGVGIAKVKVAGKEEAGHGKRVQWLSGKESNDYTPIATRLASPSLQKFTPVRLSLHHAACVEM
jgi:hypothetical protein